MFCGLLFGHYMLCGFRLTASDYPFGIFNFFLKDMFCYTITLSEESLLAKKCFVPNIQTYHILYYSRGIEGKQRFHPGLPIE
jgi:hypothetical protein